jgi:hypothetical protein
VDQFQCRFLWCWFSGSRLSLQVFSLIADINAIAITALCIFALSAAAAIFLILELSEPFTGFDDDFGRIAA